MNAEHLIDPRVDAYATTATSPAPRPIADAERHTYEVSDLTMMLSGPVVGRFLAMVAFVSGARRALEIGCYSGTSAMWMASALPPDGEVITIEFDEAHAQLAREHIAASPWRDQISVVEGDALTVLATLDGPFDVVFVDADKDEYRAYIDAVAPMLSPRGVIVLDNMLRDGGVLAPSDPSHALTDELNRSLANDTQWSSTFLPVRDGLVVLHARPQGERST